jgi:cytochrome c5
MMRMVLNRFFAVFFALILASCAESETRMQDASRQPDYTRGRHVYNAFCAECHDFGDGGAPRLNDPAAWEPRTLEMPSLLTDHATKGFLGMPEKGAHSELSDEAVRDAVYFMIKQIASGE